MSVRLYYEEDGIELWHGDCREARLHADVLITDPPYGLELGAANNPARNSGYGSHLGKKGYANYSDTYAEFVSIIVPALNLWIDHTRRAAVFTGPHIHEQRKPDSIGGIYCPNAGGRTPWGSKNLLPVLFYGLPAFPGRHRPTMLESIATAELNGHPCPKPLQWLLWLVQLASEENEMIVDPFAGSGTTLIAAKGLGRRAIGCEIEERYCEIAARRLQNTPRPLFTLEPEPARQLALEVGA